MATKRLDTNGNIVGIKQQVTSLESAAKADFMKAKPFVSDTFRRALHTFWQTLIPTVVILLTSTSSSDLRIVGLGGLGAAGGAALSLIKSAIVAQLTKGNSNYAG